MRSTFEFGHEGIHVLVLHIELTMESLSEDSLALVVSYLDLESAVTYTQRVSKRWQRRCCSSESILFAWRRIFQNLAFSSCCCCQKINSSSCWCISGECLTPDMAQIVAKEQCSLNPDQIQRIVQLILHQIKHRTRLQQTLFGRNNNTSRLYHPHRHFPLMNHRLFRFLPVFPSLLEDYVLDMDSDVLWDDPPPVAYPCGSFILTCTAVGCELLFLNPFSNSLVLFESVLDNVVRSEHEMTLWSPVEFGAQLFQAIGSAKKKPAAEVRYGLEQDVLESTTYRVHNNHSIQNAFNRYLPKHVLIRAHEVVNGSSYFFGTARATRIEVVYMGIDAKPVLSADDGLPTGTTMLALGRTICNEPAQEEPFLQCLEVIAWFWRDEDSSYQQWVCRVRGDLMAVECCASTRRVYVNPVETNSTEVAPHWLHRSGSHIIFVYPMIASDDSPESDPSKYFPPPTFALDCTDRVASVAVCASGTRLVVPTVAHNLLVWRVGPEATTVLEQSISLSAAVRDAFGRRAISPISLLVACMPVLSVHCPRMMPIEMCGFCTLQACRTYGSTVLLWHLQFGEWRFHTMINLPLSARRHPKLHYDGNRLIVFGQDHIGFIILVYQVLSTAQHLSGLNAKDIISVTEEACGGVFHATTTARVRFVNRIRHAALGDIASYEDLRMTCNERFVIVNTNTGNLLSEGTVPFRQGLLIIDLEQDINKE
jgi:hypothetical protein